MLPLLLAAVSIGPGLIVAVVVALAIVFWPREPNSPATSRVEAAYPAAVKLDDRVQAFRNLEDVRKHLHGRGLDAEATPNIDALFGLINRST